MSLVSFFLRVRGPAYERANESVQFMAGQAKMRPPKVRVVPHPIPTAAALKYRRRVLVSSAAVELLDQPMLDSVVGHELCHIHDRIRIILTGYAVKASVLMSLAVPSILDVHTEPGSIGLVAASLTATRAWSRAASRHFEYRADAFSVRLTRDPQPLATLLTAIDFSESIGRMLWSTRRNSMPRQTLLRRVRTRVFSNYPPIPKRVSRMHAIDLR
jgi:heat shock protein HtpX